MADPLSVTASLISLLGFALHGSKRLFEFIDGLRGAPSDIAALSIDLKALYEVLAVLAGMQDELERSGSMCDCLRTSLENCVNIFEEFTTKLRSYTTTTREGKVKISMWKNITWAFKEKEIQLFRGTMTSYKASLDLAVGAITLSSATAISERTKRIEVDLKEGMSHIRAKLQTLDVDHIELASITGAKGSERYGTDAGFALDRFIGYEESLYNSPPPSFPGSPNVSVSDPSNDFDTTFPTLDSGTYLSGSNGVLYSVLPQPQRKLL
ncbi:hypothetical protein F5Y04DRAFT_260634 [Hypomontagnella monticulosa]|nr:hypothetical protein F5Y04DRAFT_260634 [Hypomontagnella monticulosa]